jgi:hypothetical protein
VQTERGSTLSFSITEISASSITATAWYLDGVLQNNSELWTSVSMTTSDLTLGGHVLTVVVTDTSGQKRSASANIWLE